MPKTKSTLSKNIAYVMIYHLFTAIAPLIITPYISRVLGATEIGKYTYAYSIAYYFVMVANLGISTHGSRRIAEVKHDEEKLKQVFSNLLWLHITISGAVTIIYIIAVFIGMNRDNRGLSLIMTFYVLSSVFDVKWLFYGLEQFRPTVFRSIIIRILNIVLIFVLVKNREDVGIYTFIMAFVGFFIAEVILFVLAFHRLKISKPNIGLLFKDFIPLLILFIPSVANLLLRHFDKIMIGLLSTYEQLGLYENTDRILVILSLLTTSLGDVMLPRVSSLLANKKGDYAVYVFNTVLRFSTILSCALTFGLIAISDEFVPYFFGDEFVGCIQLIKWIAPNIIILNLSVSIRKQYLIPTHRERVFLTATGIGLATNILGNAILIPKQGALGAVYSTLVAELIVVLIQYIMIHKQVNYSRYFGDIVKYSIIGIIMYIGVRMIALLRLAYLPLLVLEILLGAFIYILLSYAVLKISHDEILDYLKRIVFRKIAN